MGDGIQPSDGAVTRHRHPCRPLAENMPELRKQSHHARIDNGF
jgi:hypothetical protein